jgi:hypothetical protein
MATEYPGRGLAAGALCEDDRAALERQRRLPVLTRHEDLVRARELGGRATHDDPLIDPNVAVERRAADPHDGLVAAVRDKAKETFKKLMTKEGKGGCCPVVQNRDSVYAACIYVACRSLGVPLTYKELTFSSVSTAQAAVARKDIGRMTTHIKRLLEEEDGLQPGQGRRPCRVVPEPDSHIELCPRDLSD